MLSLPWGAGFHAGALRFSGGRLRSLPACWGKRQTVLIGDAKGELAPNIHIQALRWGFMGAIEGLPRDLSTSSAARIVLCTCPWPPSGICRSAGVNG